MNIYKPSVSILIPIYKVENYIEICSRSLFEQTYDNIEYIFVDDCSPDNSISILNKLLEEYPERAKHTTIIRHDKNCGLSVTRNTGLFKATGKYVLFVDSDDYIDRNTVERLVATALEKEADIVVYDMKYLYTNKTVTGHQTISENTMDFVKQLLLYKVDVCMCGKLFKRSLFSENEIRFIDGLNFGEDYVTSSRVAYFAKKIAHCKGVYYNYLQFNPTSYTRAYTSKNIDDLLRAISILEHFFDEIPDSDQYRETIEKAKQMVKIQLLIAVSLHYDAVGESMLKIVHLYNEHNLKLYKSFSKSHRIILWLARYEQIWLLRKYVSIGFKIKQIFK